MSFGKWWIRGGLVLLITGLGVFQYRAMNLPLAPQLVSLDHTTRNMAFAKFLKQSEKKKMEVVTEILKAPVSPDPKARRYALYVLRQIDSPQQDVISYCVAALADTDSAVREEASAALFRFGAPVIPNLIGVLRSQEGIAVGAAEKVLHKYNERAVPALAAFIDEKPSKGLPAAVRVLRLAGPAAKEAVPSLTRLLQTEDAVIRLEVAEGLFDLGALEKDALPALAQDMLSAKESYSDPLAPRPRLAELLEKADPRRREVVDLAFDLRQKKADIRYRAAYVISRMNPVKLGCMEMLVTALPDKDIYVSARALAALTSLGLAKTQRIKKIAYPNIRSALKRAEAAKIEGYAPIAGKVKKSLK